MCIHVCIYLSIYLSPSLLLGHRLSTTVCQSSLFWAIFSNKLYEWPVFLMSTSRSQRQVFLGLPPYFSYAGDSSREPVLWHLMLYIHLPSLCLFQDRIKKYMGKVKEATEKKEGTISDFCFSISSTDSTLELVCP